MDPSQLFSVLKPILNDIHRYQQPCIDSRQLSQQWNQCKISLDKLIKFLSSYPSIVDILHPIPNFSSSISLTIPQSYSTDTISNFNCVPYFVYNNYRDHPHTQLINNFCKLSTQTKINKYVHPCTFIDNYINTIKKMV